MIAVALGAALVFLAAQDGPTVRAAPERSVRVSPSPPPPGARAAAEEYLRHIYAVYLSIRGCSEASAAHGKPGFLPGVPLDEVRRAMRQIDLAAKEVGLDVETDAALAQDARTRFRVAGMDCASCANKVENAVRRVLA